MSTEVTPSTTLPALWALRSKHPGTMMGYEIVAGAGDEQTAGELFRAGTVGNTAPVPPGQPDAYPWLAFVPGRSASILACVETGWTEQTDGTGQPIAPLRLVYLPYSQAADRLPTCRTLAAAVAGLHWPAVDQGPAPATADGRIGLTLPTSEVDDLVDAVAGNGFDWAAVAATVLLDGGSVAIVAEPDAFPGTAERLTALDAVLALLPHWYRTRVSAATWASPRAQHTIRLGFTSRAGAGQTEIRWRTRPASPQLRNPDVHRYFEELYTAANDHEIGVAGIVRHLAARRQPPDGEPVAAALNDLREIRLAELVYNEVRGGYGHPLRVDAVLAPGWQTLDPDKQREFTLFLVSRAGVADDHGREAAETLARRWDPQMVDFLLDRLADADADRARHEIAEVYRLAPPGSGAADRLFQRLLARPEPSLAVLVDLLFDPPPAVDARSPAVAMAILRRLALFRSLLRRLQRETPARVAGQIVGLDKAVGRDAPAWWRPFAAVAHGDPARATPDDVADLLREWPDAGGELLEIADRCGVVGRMLELLWPALAGWIGDAAGLGPAPALPDLSPPGHREAARADLLHLLAAGHAPYLAAYPTMPPKEYFAGLAAGWAHPAIVARASTIIPSLLRDAHRTPGQTRIDALCAIGDALSDGAVTTAVAVALDGEMTLARPRQLCLGKEWAQRVYRVAARPTEFWHWWQLGDIVRTPGATVVAVGEEIRRAMAQATPIEDLLLLISTWLVQRPEGHDRDSAAWDLVCEISGAEPALTDHAVIVAFRACEGYGPPELTNLYRRVIGNVLVNGDRAFPFRALLGFPMPGMVPMPPQQPAQQPPPPPPPLQREPVFVPPPPPSEEKRSGLGEFITRKIPGRRRS